MLRTLSFLLIATLISLGGARTAPAAARIGGDPGPATEPTADLRQRLAPLGTGPDARIEVRRRDGTKVKGYVTQLGTAAIAIASQSGATTQVPYDDIAKVRGHNLSTGWKIAIGAGIAVGVVLLVLVVFLTTQSD